MKCLGITVVEFVDGLLKFFTVTITRKCVKIKHSDLGVTIYRRKCKETVTI